MRPAIGQLPRCALVFMYGACGRWGIPQLHDRRGPVIRWRVPSATTAGANGPAVPAAAPRVAAPYPRTCAATARLGPWGPPARGRAWALRRGLAGPGGPWHNRKVSSCRPPVREVPHGRALPTSPPTGLPRARPRTPWPGRFRRPAICRWPPSPRRGRRRAGRRRSGPRLRDPGRAGPRRHGRRLQGPAASASTASSP